MTHVHALHRQQELLVVVAARLARRRSSSGAPFRRSEIVPLRGISPIRRIARSRRPALVPALHDGDVVSGTRWRSPNTWPSAIRGMWPADAGARAWARSIAAEMHSGFSALRNDMTMCIRERVDVRPVVATRSQPTSRASRSIWNESRRRFGAGGDVPVRRVLDRRRASTAPVAFRFQTYGVAAGGRRGRLPATRCSRIRSCGSGRPPRSRRRDHRGRRAARPLSRQDRRRRPRRDRRR